MDHDMTFDRGPPADHLALPADDPARVLSRRDRQPRAADRAAGADAASAPDLGAALGPVDRAQVRRLRARTRRSRRAAPLRARARALHAALVLRPQRRPSSSRPGSDSGPSADGSSARWSSACWRATRRRTSRSTGTGGPRSRPAPGATSAWSTSSPSRVSIRRAEASERQWLTPSLRATSASPSARFTPTIRSVASQPSRSARANASPSVTSTARPARNASHTPARTE